MIEVYGAHDAMHTTATVDSQEFDNLKAVNADQEQQIAALNEKIAQLQEANSILQSKSDALVEAMAVAPVVSNVKTSKVD